MLDKFPVTGRSANFNYSTARASALAVGAGRGCLDIFSLIFLTLSGRRSDID